MDINNILTGTINSLNDYAASGKIGTVNEIPIVHPELQNGGKDAAGESYHRIVSTLNEAAKNVDTRVSFNYHEPTKRIIMKIVDPSTHEVIKQVPSKDMIQLLEDINKMVGLFVDERG